ncbi:MAG: hypothetical protein ABIJ52_09440 [Pseudomonadota bacterium]|nr:hypothetical protein [Pseudomonadota bacterium]
MTVATSKRRFQAVLACLLILCLSPAAMPAQWLYGGDKSVAGSEAVLFTPSFANSESPALANGTRNRLNGFDDLIKAAIIPGQMPIVVARKSSPYLFNHDADVSHRTDRKAIPVRAPPLHRFC